MDVRDELASLSMQTNVGQDIVRKSVLLIDILREKVKESEGKLGSAEALAETNGRNYQVMLARALEAESRLDFVLGTAELACFAGDAQSYKSAMETILMRLRPAVVERQARNCLRVNCTDSALDGSNYCRDHAPEDWPRRTRP